MLKCNSKWKMTELGVERADSAFAPYRIARARIARLTERDGVTYLEWPVQLAEKSWVDLVAFLEIFTAAINAWVPSTDPELLRRSIAYARSRVAVAAG